MNLLNELIDGLSQSSKPQHGDQTRPYHRNASSLTRGHADFFLAPGGNRALDFARRPIQREWTVTSSMRPQTQKDPTDPSGQDMRPVPILAVTVSPHCEAPCA